MHDARRVDWDGFHNARDLGGLPTLCGGTTRFGSLFRAAAPGFATAEGWRQAREAGIRTVVDLRRPDEIRQLAAAPPPGVDRVEVDLDDAADTAFWDRVRAAGAAPSNPLYYRLFLEHKAERCAAAATALARAAPGGVLFHCAAGRDRTGLVAILLLALAGVGSEAIADDYEQSTAGLRPLHAALGRADDAPAIAAALAERGTTPRETVLDVRSGIDAPSCLRGGGMAEADIAALRSRLSAG
ncbi:tyrosine-protein phosphatase [Streptomonospora sp. PA3]|uniref:tyrosine-protein phosphatase n=1 Tax=Streptomonospora sp. PA3 TaxID=2607326 RepID=UPI0012DFA69C|nr:tyrosine-protein phosphatase [Streptomonospora sp. PA3]MUL42878.1 tyrosine-protein phosphatase [Streptomonospora sp. PA3]